MYVYKHISGLMAALKIMYKSSYWRFYTDSSKIILKAVHPHNSAVLPPIQVSQLVQMKKKSCETKFLGVYTTINISDHVCWLKLSLTWIKERIHQILLHSLWVG